MKIVVIDHNSTMIPQMGVMIDEALMAKSQGHTITYITCGACLDSCYSNPLKNKLFCKICIADYKTTLAPYLDKNLKHTTLNEYSTPEIESAVSKFDYSFSTFLGLKEKIFRGVDVGYATLSSFISNTRNMNPVLSDFTREILTKSLKAAVRQSALCERIMEVEKPDRIYVYNGRMPENRPILRYFQAKGIPVDVHEDYPTNLTGSFKKVIFPNCMPHSIEFFQRRIQEEWNKDPVKAEEVGKRFFNNRRNAAFAGDKVYVKDQKTGLLPQSWNSNSRNIVIFNSSEDEFAAIGGEWEDKLFETQMKGIEYIFDCVEKYPDAEVYLRVHPNLKSITYKYHTDLYNLKKHPRIHVIPADSEVSTYALADSANVIVSFGTSVGVEAAYSGKAVVLLGASFYKGLGFCYEPASIPEMEKMVFVDELASKQNQNTLKYGNFIMCDKGTGFSFYNFNCTQITIGKFRTPNVAMIDQSKTTFGLLKSFMMRVWRQLQRRYLKLRIPEI
jgi:hypothetical protein